MRKAILAMVIAVPFVFALLKLLQFIYFSLPFGVEMQKHVWSVMTMFIILIPVGQYLDKHYPLR